MKTNETKTIYVSKENEQYKNGNFKNAKNTRVVSLRQLKRMVKLAEEIQKHNNHPRNMGDKEHFIMSDDLGMMRQAGYSEFWRIIPKEFKEF